MSRIESKLAELGLTLPSPPPPGGNYLPFRIEGKTLYLPAGDRTRLALGDLDRVDHVISVSGYVNCVAGFPDSPKVINGASDLLVALLGDDGRHVRAAVGVAGLPANSATEVQMIVALK
ncbi:MAG: RidA family protein [Proteobacteria bacterium]|nr:RidA family protein [Pseudomonadota bacterium]